MTKSTKFYIKIMIKNPLFVISLLFDIFLLTRQYGMLSNSIFEFDEVFYFGYISSNLFFVVINTYIMYKTYDICEFIETNLFKKQLGVILASFIISTITSLIPILVILIFKNPNLTTAFVINGIIHFFILWTLSNLLASTIGSSIGCICKNTLSIILSVGTFSLLIYHSFQYSNTILYKLFNIYDDYVFLHSNNICGHILDTSYYLDKLFILLLILLVFSFSCIFNKKIKKIHSTTFLGLILICLYAITQLSFVYESKPLKKYASLTDVNYSVESYNMNINLDKNFQNKTTINLNINKTSNNIIMLLDNLFKIDNLLINGAKVEFHHENDKLTIKHDFNKGDRVNILIKYKGHIDIMNNLGTPIYYVSPYATNLPIDSFYWYPKSPNHSLINFNVSVKCLNYVYSNLNLCDSNNNICKFKGNSIGLNLFSGQYKKFTFNNIEYILPINKPVNKIEFLLNTFFNDLIKSNTLSKKELDLLKNHKYKKIIFGVWDTVERNKSLKSNLQIFEDTLIINNR